MNNLGIGPINNFVTTRPIVKKKTNQVTPYVSKNGLCVGSVFSILGKKENPSLKDQGNCIWLQSAEQPVFGPYLWTAFHLIAVNYPDEPVKEAQMAFMSFVNSIPYLIPCANCGFHFQQFLHRDYLPQLNGNLTAKLKIITKSKDNLITFFVEAHNNVTKRTNKTARLWTPEEAKEYYNFGYRCVNPNIVPWEDAALKKARNSTCVEFIKSEYDGTKQCKTYKIV